MPDQPQLFATSEPPPQPAISPPLDYIDKHLIRLTDEIMKRDRWCSQMGAAQREDVSGTIFADLRSHVDMWLKHIDDYQGIPP